MSVLIGYAGSGSDRAGMTDVLLAMGDYTQSHEFSTELGHEITVMDCSVGMHRSVTQADAIIRDNWPAVDAVAAALIQEKRITGKSVREIVKQSRMRQPR